MIGEGQGREWWWEYWRDRAVDAEKDASDLRQALDAAIDLLSYCHTGPVSRSRAIICERGGIGCSVRHSWIEERKKQLGL